MHDQADFRSAIDVPALLKQLESPVDTTRANAFYSIIWEPTKGGLNAAEQTRHLLAANPKLAARIVNTLTRALELENARVKATNARPLPRLYQNYHTDLSASVAAARASIKR